LGQEHPETAETTYHLAQLREAQDKNEKARTWYVHALAIRERTLGKSHPKTVETRSHLVALLHTMQLHGEAILLETAEPES
jgi:hypothetical protein